MCVCVSVAERGKNACRQRMNRTLRRRRGGGAGAAGGGRPKTQCGSKRTPSGERWRVDGGGGVQGGGLPAVRQKHQHCQRVADEATTRPPCCHVRCWKGGERGRGVRLGMEGGGHHSCSPPTSPPSHPALPIIPLWVHISAKGATGHLQPDSQLL